MFYRYTDSDTNYHWANHGGTKPLNADIIQINWAYNDNGYINNTIYSEFKIINRSNKIWKNFIAGVFFDDDLGNATDDNYGCDSSLGLGYVYNSNNNDGEYGLNPPAVGTVFLRGLRERTIDSSETYFLCSGKNKIAYTGYTDKKVTASVNVPKHFGFPLNYAESYRVLKGLQNTGRPFINPVGNFPTKFSHSGDPVTNQGWVMSGGDDRYFLMASGSLDVNPGDTQIIVIAQVIARGNSNLNSITKLREASVIARENYENCFANLYLPECRDFIPYEYSLKQNFPNPFNPLTTIRYSIKEPIDVTLTVYDVLGREVSILVNERKFAGEYEVIWNGRNFASGVYFYKIAAKNSGDVKYTKSMKMVLLK